MHVSWSFVIGYIVYAENGPTIDRTHRARRRCVRFGKRPPHGPGPRPLSGGLWSQLLCVTGDRGHRIDNRWAVRAYDTLYSCTTYTG